MVNMLSDTLDGHADCRLCAVTITAGHGVVIGESGAWRCFKRIRWARCKCCCCPVMVTAGDKDTIDPETWLVPKRDLVGTL